MQWWRLFFTEAIVIFVVLIGLGFVKLPKFLRRRKLARGFPWGYYADAVPKTDPGFSAHNTDFLHDVGTSFGGVEGFGDYGEFSGFGELGEFGQNFSYGSGGE